MKLAHPEKIRRLRLAGQPSLDCKSLPPPDRVAVLPEKIPHVRPRLLIREGDAVKIGTPLFEDKQNPMVKFTSPGGGTVARINLGPRRVVREIVIDLDAEEQAVRFTLVDEAGLAACSRETLVQALLAAGVWPFLRALPYRTIAPPAVVPPIIFIALGSLEPFQPSAKVYLKGQMGLFGLGLKILKKLSDRIVLLTDDPGLFPRETIDGVSIQSHGNDYPTDNPAVGLYHTRTSAAENTAWYISGQDLLQVARFIRFSRYPVERTVVLAGSAALQPQHFQTRAGAPLEHLFRDRISRQGPVRMIQGGVFTGYAGSAETFLGFYENALVLASEAPVEELFGFARPGISTPSLSRAFFSAFHRKELTVDCRQHGEVRACINCSYCTDICPVDILPSFTLKCILADEIEEAAAHGLLDCAECGLCTFVCPAKINLCETFKTAKANYLKELL